MGETVAKTNVRGNSKTLVGRIVSNKMQKTVVVAIEDLVKHPIYKKYVKRTANLKVHDEQNRCQVGDIVRVKECRPLSKEKRWQVIEVISTN